MDSERELEVIRDEMEQTRANLADKLGALEEQVRETVTSASETVTSTVEGVKDVVGTVSETVTSVTETFNISKQVEQHPMLSMGVALAAGFALGQLLGGGSSRSAPPPQPQYPPAPPPEPRRQPAAEKPAAQPQPEAGIMGQAASLLPSLESLLPDIQGIGNTVISGLGGLAVGSVMSVVRELAANNLPQEWKGEINKLVDQVTRELGGKVQPPKQEQKEQDASKSQEHRGDQGKQDKPEERPQGEQRTFRNTRQPVYHG